ncbi:MAG: hypothetical protein IPM47_11980 [Sphingobacteriales bacterium]|nr:MAG: hypothetical protein IPM47_11980 [Sphingobacteriales bacterium]
MISNKIQLFVWGTKKGLEFFFGSNGIDPSFKDSIKPQKEKDVRSGIIMLDELKISKQVFYSIELAKNYKVYTRYNSITDWANRAGYIAISIIMPISYWLPGKTVELLNEFYELYKEKYIDQENWKILDVSENPQLFEKVLEHYELKKSIGDSTGSSNKTHNACIYYDENNKLNLFFDNPFLEEFSNFKTIFFLKEGNDKPGIGSEVIELKGVEPRPLKRTVFVNLVDGESAIPHSYKLLVDGIARTSGEKFEVEVQTTSVKITFNNNGYEEIEKTHPINDQNNPEVITIFLKKKEDFVFTVFDKDTKAGLENVLFTIEGHQKGRSTTDGKISVAGYYNEGNKIKGTLTLEDYTNKEIEVAHNGKAELTKLPKPQNGEKGVSGNNSTSTESIPQKIELKLQCKGLLVKLSEGDFVIVHKKDGSILKKFLINSPLEIDKTEADQVQSVEVSVKGYKKVEKKVSYATTQQYISINLEKEDPKPKSKKFANILIVLSSVLFLLAFSYLGWHYFSGKKKEKVFEANIQFLKNRSSFMIKTLDDLLNEPSFSQQPLPPNLSAIKSEIEIVRLKLNDKSGLENEIKNNILKDTTEINKKLKEIVSETKLNGWKIEINKSIKQQVPASQQSESKTPAHTANTTTQELEQRSKTIYKSRSGKTEDRIKSIQKDLELLPNSGLSSEKQEKIKERLNEFLKVVINDKDVRNNKNCQQSRANLNMANKSAVLSQDQENFLKKAQVNPCGTDWIANQK